MSAAEARKETLTVLRNGAWMTHVRPSDKRGRTLKVSLRTDGFVPVLHLQGDVAMAVNALSGMEGVRARSPIGSSLLRPQFPVDLRSSSVSPVASTSSSSGVSLCSPRARWRASGHVWWPRAVPCVRGFCFILVLSIDIFCCRQYHTAPFLIAGSGRELSSEK